jgi:hypothetical protein
MKKLSLVYLILILVFILVFVIVIGRINEAKNTLLTNKEDNQTINNSQTTGFAIESNQTINNSQIINITAENNQTINKSKTIKSSSGGGGGGGGSSKAKSSPAQSNPPTTSYPVHGNISVTFFWVGEESSSDNGYIPNSQSAWDDNWQQHYGGVDNPDKRNGYFPSGFTPKENPFYFALPYNDFDENGERRANVNIIYWYNEKNYNETQSICKNQWIKITKDNKVVYAQWEDVGPFNEDDVNYVFGSSKPENKINNNAGLDVSPAVHDYLNLQDIDSIDWQFVNFSDVPEGPWKQIITSSQVFWN